MKVRSLVDRLVGSSSETARDPHEEAEPSHVCESCGEEYYANPSTDIRTCRRCGGVKVRPT